MALEFNKLLLQVEKMGAMIRAVDFDISEKLSVAIERWHNAGDLQKAYDYIRIVRQKDISGYRGAAPLDPPYGQTPNFVYPAPPPPPQATIIAADGSQVYPNEQAAVHFYLLNVGMFVYFHGLETIPLTVTEPQLFYHKSDVHDGANRVVSNRTVDARRTVQEMQHLARAAWELRREGAPQPLIALYDNHLLFWANSDITGGGDIYRDYLGALNELHSSGAILAGYLDSPHRSRVILRLLYLLSLADEDEIHEKQDIVARGGDLEGLRDIQLLDAVLQPGERTAVMVQNSPRNLSYRQYGENYEIAFFYVKIFNSFQTAIARVDIPAWVARNPEAIDLLHGLLLDQCQMQGRTPYPYALTRADELALVSSRDKRKLDELVTIELRRRGLAPKPITAKDQSKQAARSDKRPHEIRGDLRERR